MKDEACFTFSVFPSGVFHFSLKCLVPVTLLTKASMYNICVYFTICQTRMYTFNFWSTGKVQHMHIRVSDQEPRGVAYVELKKKDGSSLGLVVSGKQHRQSLLVA